MILTPGFPENESDTTCIPALQLYVKALQQLSDFEITIISFHYPDKKTKYHWNQIPVIALGGSSRLSKLLLWKRASEVLKQLHQQKRISVLHSFWLGECALIGNWFARKKNIRHLTTLMGQDALKQNGYAKILPIKKMKLVTLSGFHQQVFYQNHKVTTEIIPWGIAAEDFPQATEKSIDIIGIGSLIPIKNHALFMDVVGELSKIRPINAVLVGDGILKDKLDQKIRELNLETTLQLKGELPYLETLKLLSKAKILLHTSTYESFGLVFAEALQSKTLIVSEKTGCTFETENWVTATSKEEMIEACLTLLDKPFSEVTPNPFLITKTVERYLKRYAD
ncbi:glycosyltransferase [Flavobacterium pedocola]